MHLRILNNARKHAAEHGRLLPRDWLDRFCSAASFPGWAEPSPATRADCNHNCCSPPRSWLLAHGWRQCGPISIEYIPGQYVLGESSRLSAVLTSRDHRGLVRTAGVARRKAPGAQRRR